MEYFLGSLITILTILFVGALSYRKLSSVSSANNSIRYSQSHIFEIISPIVPFIDVKLPQPITQASKHNDSQYVRVIIVDESAYWITKNQFFTAEVDDGGIVKESTKPVDTMGMDKVQLDKMIFIVEKLTEGTQNDSSSPRDSWF